VKIFTIIQRCLLTEYVLFTSFILITILHNAVRKFGTFLMRHPVFQNYFTGLLQLMNIFEHVHCR